MYKKLTAFGIFLAAVSSAIAQDAPPPPPAAIAQPAPAPQPPRFEAPPPSTAIQEPAQTLLPPPSMTQTPAATQQWEQALTPPSGAPSTGGTQQQPATGTPPPRFAAEPSAGTPPITAPAPPPTNFATQAPAGIQQPLRTPPSSVGTQPSAGVQQPVAVPQPFATPPLVGMQQPTQTPAPPPPPPFATAPLVNMQQPAPGPAPTVAGTPSPFAGQQQPFPVAPPSAVSQVPTLPPPATAKTPLSPPTQTPQPPPSAVNNITVSPGLIGNALEMRAAPPFGRSWIGADYLMWWFKDAPVPVPLVTTSNAADAGIVGRPSTQVLFGNQSLDAGLQSGVQLNMGLWLDNEEVFGLEASGFFFAARNYTNFSEHTGNPNQLLAVPYINPSSGPAAFIISGTNPNTGSAIVGSITATSSTSLWGVELNGLANLIRNKNFQLNLLVGFRNVDLQESLDMNYVAQGAPGSGSGPLYNATLADQFTTRNQFYGGQLGLTGEWSKGFFYGSAVGKIALGINHETVNVNGQFVDSNGTFFSTYGAGPGGLLAQRTNIGSYTSNPFAVVPEFQLRLGVNLMQNVQAFIGYDFLFMSHVVRPGDQVDSVINPSQAGPNASGGGIASVLTGSARPMPLFNESTFWAQGFSIGLQITF